MALLWTLSPVISIYRTLKGSLGVFSWSLFFLKLKILKLQTCKGQFCHRFFFLILEILQHPVLSASFHKSICSKVYRLVVSCTLYSYNFIKRKLHYVHFSEVFQSFQWGFFKTLYIENICDEVYQSSVDYRLWFPDYSSVFKLKSG